MSRKEKIETVVGVFFLFVWVVNSCTNHPEATPWVLLSVSVYMNVLLWRALRSWQAAAKGGR